MPPTGASLLLSPESIRLGAAFLLGAVLLFVTARQARGLVTRYVLFWAVSVALRALAGGAALYLPSAAPTLSFLGLLFQGLAYLGLASVLLFDILLPRARIPLPRIARDVAIALTWLGLLIWLFSVHQVDITGIVATSAVVTAVIGFSLQDTLANVMGGIALQVERSFVPGDWVKWGDASGRVRETGWRHTAIETRNGDTLLVPNSVLAKTPLYILGRSADRKEPLQRRWVYFSVDHRTSPVAVLETVREALALLDDPTDSVVRTRIAAALGRAGIPLAIPSNANFVTVEREGHRGGHEEREREASLSALESVPLFASLTGEEKARLAPGLGRVVFAPGEAMVVQGNEVNDLYILTRGAADVRVAVPDAPHCVIGRIEAPNIFGEMGMLTGEPRAATVLAVGETECWRLGKEKFREVLKERPAIAEEVSRLLAARLSSLATARDGLSEESRQQESEVERESLRVRIERFSGLGARPPAGERNEP